MKPTYESPLASRYASKTMLHLFSPDMRYETWRRLWVALARAEHTLGLPITQAQVDELNFSLSEKARLALEQARKYAQIMESLAELNFETAAELRDKLVELKKYLNELED